MRSGKISRTWRGKCVMPYHVSPKIRLRESVARSVYEAEEANADGQTTERMRRHAAYRKCREVP